MGILDGRAPFGADASKCSHRPSAFLRTPLSKHQLPKSSDPSNSKNGNMKIPKCQALFGTLAEMNHPATL